MKRMKTIMACLLCGVFLAAAVPEYAIAEEAPYQTYAQDKWGNATPMPHGYLPTRSINGNGLGCGDFNNPSDLFYSRERQEVYLVDSGNARIIVLNQDFELKSYFSTLLWPDGREYALSNPQGIYVRADGVMYIAEMGNQEVVICDKEGRIQEVFGTPSSRLLPDDFHYLPSKIVADQKGRMYILAQGVYQGLVYLEPDGTFIKFFGANDVEMTFRRRIMKIWKNILSDEAAATMQSFNPIEYSNIFLSSDGYIYATAAASETNSKLVSRLNPLGINTMPYDTGGASIRFVDITVNDNGVVSALDSNLGVIVQMNENGTIFTFGNRGSQVGLFERPVSLIDVQGDLYVLDAGKNSITKFELTEYGSIMHRAIELYNKGLYEESIEPWEEVIKRNSNCLMAYTGLGKAYYQLKDYDAAMYYCKLANDRENYSDAFRAASLNRIRESFGGIVFGIVFLTAAVIALRKCGAHRKRRKEAGA